MKVDKKQKLTNALKSLKHDLDRMDKEEDYDLFDDWEIGEVSFLIGEAICELRGQP